MKYFRLQKTCWRHLDRPKRYACQAGDWSRFRNQDWFRERAGQARRSSQKFDQNSKLKTIIYHCHDQILILNYLKTFLFPDIQFRRAAQGQGYQFAYAR